MSSKIVFYKGRRGSGKTLTMVKDAYKYKKLGWRVLSNITLGFSEIVTSDYLLSLDRDSDLRDAVLVIDEIEVFFDSRSWNSNVSKKFSYFLQQIRKRNIIILCTAQFVTLVDLRLRQQIDILALPNFNKNNFLVSTYYVDLTSFESSKIPDYRGSLYYAKPIFSLYDTEEMVV